MTLGRIYAMAFLFGVLDFGLILITDSQWVWTAHFILFVLVVYALGVNIERKYHE